MKCRCGLGAGPEENEEVLLGHVQVCCAARIDAAVWTAWQRPNKIEKKKRRPYLTKLCMLKENYR